MRIVGFIPRHRKRVERSLCVHPVKGRGRIESVILDFVNTKLDLYTKLSEQKVKTALKERWFGEFEAGKNASEQRP